MKIEDIVKRLDELIKGGSDRSISSSELFHGAFDIMAIIYGPSSVQLQNFIKEEETVRQKYAGDSVDHFRLPLTLGALSNMRSAVNTGLIGSFQNTISGEVLTDFLQLARTVLEEKGDDAKNIASVLTAALFEDTIRRLAINNGLPHIEKLQDVLIGLKDRGILQGPQFGIANSYLNFRNNALHAQWDKVERESIASILSFSEQIIIRYFV